MGGPFPQVAKDMPAVNDLVRREAGEECVDYRLPTPVLDACVRDAVVAMWGSRIKTYVPLLALRRVRCCIRTGTCDGDDW